MTDPLFKQFLVSRVETLKNELSDTSLDVDVVIEKATEIKKIQNRIQKIENPPVRKKPEAVAEAA
jgi:hypothetical protein